ncbi:MAG: F0F1 ATP synthase subunit A [Deltaproteobacteria bacterium]|jgi:F-type H+-transporting ATPase subunit a|nr:F0F1 ATP synthase subunit A [Deltaproteobacteria bacterium]
MASGLVHPILLSTELGLDNLVINGQLVEFRHVFYTWVVLGLLIILGLFAKRRLKMVPTGTQNVLEALIGGLEDFVITNMGEVGRKFVPLLTGMFIFILGMNLIGFVPLFDAPTANLNTAASMAMIVFLYYNWLGLKRWGPKYIKHFTGPMPILIPLMLPLEILSNCARPVSLSFRLFGNLRGGEVVLLIFFGMAPLFSTLPVYFMFVLTKSLQAFIFFMLTMVYIQGALDHAH